MKWSPKMALNRLIPCLLMQNGALVKTRGFKKPAYIGDPINTVRMFSELQADEILLLDIGATRSGRGPQFELIEKIAVESFVPLSYGGGISHLEDVRRILEMGVEKVVFNTAFFRNPSLIRESANAFGSQSVIVALDVKEEGGSPSLVATDRGSVDQLTLSEGARRAVELGAGELLVQSVDRDGMWSGYDLAMIEAVARGVDVPVICVGGAASLKDFSAARSLGASAQSAGSFFVYQSAQSAVLVHYPSPAERVEYDI